MSTPIRLVALDMAGTTISDGGIVVDAFHAALADAGLTETSPEWSAAERIVHETMGQSKIDVFRRVLGDEPAADLVLSPADAGRGRPFPDLLWTAMLRLGAASVDEVAVAGDPASDMETAQRAGVRVRCGVLTPEGAHVLGRTVIVRDRADRPSGDPVSALVRPEGLALTPAPDGAGIVAGKTFLGSVTRVLVMLSGEVIVRVDVPSASAGSLALGDPVDVALTPDSVLVTDVA